MSGEGGTLDTRDMLAVHEAFRRALEDAPGQVASVRDGDVERAQVLADYMGEVLWLLHAHHEGEDALLYPLLAERAPEHAELFARMDAQHASVTSSLEAAERAASQFARSGSLADGQSLASACTALAGVLDPHLAEEEEHVLPIAAQLVSPPEWGALPAHALSSYTGTRMWLPFGLVLESMPDDLRLDLLGHIPPPVSEMWQSVGSDAFAKEMANIRSTT